MSESADGGKTWSDVAGRGTYLKGTAGQANFEPPVAITKTGKTAVS